MSDERNRILAKIFVPIGMICSIGAIVLITYAGVLHWMKTGERAIVAWLVVVVICVFGFGYLLKSAQNEFGWFQKKK